MSSVFCERFETTHQGQTRETLLLFNHRSTINIERLADTLEKDIERHLMPDEIVIGVPDRSFDVVAKDLAQDPIAQALWNRLNKRTTVALIGFGADGQDVRSILIAGQALPQPTLLSSLQRRGITSIFKQHDGFVHASETYHFVNPSGRHTERFIRLSNILVEGSQIGFMAYCCLAFIGEDIETVYLDTPALYSVLAAVNEIRASFGNQPLELENFRSYEGLKRVRPADEQSSMVLISASSSGGLAKRIQNEIGFPTSSLLHFLYLGTTPSGFPAVCDLAFDGTANPLGYASAPAVYEPDACELCRGNSFQVHLHGDQFDVRGPQPQPHLILHGDAPQSLGATMKRLVGINALSVRPGRTGQSRDREIHIDAAKWMDKPEIQTRLDYILRRSIPSGTTHIVSADSGSAVLCQKISDHLESAGVKPALLQAGDIDAIAGHPSPAIVVAATVIESGRCLTDISRDLRSVARDAPIVYFVGVEKTSGLPRREALKKTLIRTSLPVLHDYVAVERLVLPPSVSRNAWNDELDLFRDRTALNAITGTAAKQIADRVKRLEDLSTPLTDDLFLPNTTGAKLELQPGFVFWPDALPASPHSQADVFFTIASVLQQLRANAFAASPKAAIRSAWFHQTVLDPANFARFNDDIIQASLLRAASPAELNYRESHSESHELARIIARIVRAHHTARGGAAAEFMLALATGRLKLRPDDVQTIIEASMQGSDIVRALGVISINMKR